MAVALHFTALVGASSIQLTFWTNGQSEQRSKAPANIAGDAEVKARDPTAFAKMLLLF